MKKRKIALLSPYHGGSHSAWAEGYRKHTRHELKIFALEDRFWKWRLHGAAISLSERLLKSTFQPDLILCTDMLDLAVLRGLLREKRNTPCLFYCHENQLTYPLPADPNQGPMRRAKGERDLHYAFINYASMLAADQVFFNSAFHRTDFLKALPGYLRHFPDHRHLHHVDLIRDKSTVLPVGIDLSRLSGPSRKTAFGNPPLILWNQRWEYDKNPEGFFRVLNRAANQGLSFRVALCGRNYQQKPVEFERGIQQLGDRVVHVGHAGPKLYQDFLQQAHLILSTAHHEFFGISVVEAIYAGAFPLLPKRLSYPELLPESFHAGCLYESEEELFKKLSEALLNPESARSVASALSPEMERFNWNSLARRYDETLVEAATDL